MAYATIIHLVYHHQARASYGASTVPNASAAAMALDEAAAHLDFSLTKAGYDSPLAASVPSAVKTFFQRANAMGALAMLEVSAPQGHNRDDFQAMFKEALKAIESGQMPGMERSADESRPRANSPATAYFSLDMYT